ncbi:MAG TPA: outer membrane beta-barrel protein [Opitutaceae bacterium]|nr:outer membrane beta-barrel protein [Opitutaceae bacterium]
MIFLRALLVGGLAAALPARAVYAPIPEQEQGKNLTYTLRAGVSYDSNLFGADQGEVDSVIWTFAPKVVYDASVTDQTFVAASYSLVLDQFENRPGDKLLDSHDLSLRVAHAFSKSTTIDVTEAYTRSANPEALLVGLPPNADGTPQRNPDQSFERNQLDGRFQTPLSPKAGIIVKARTVYYNYYKNAVLARSIDRTENLIGVAGDYAILPELKGVAEYRHQDVYYRKLGETKNKHSDYLMAGADYAVAKKLSVSGRAGAEWRRRAAADDVTTPYLELSGKFDYTEGSFIVFGTSYSLEETTDTVRFTDTQVNRYFLNVQHAVTKLIVASGSFTFEPSELQGRRGQPDVEETTVRSGAALSYLPGKNWTISANYDYDHVWSGISAREMARHRVGLNALYTF